MRILIADDDRRPTMMLGQVDSYMTEHMEARFSRGICTPCLAKVMEDLDSSPVLLAESGA